MKTMYVKILALLAVLGCCGSALADSWVRVVYVCNLNDGKTMEDVRAANTAWVKYMQANVDDSISSTILTPMVGNLEAGRFIYADDFPSVEAWNAMLQASETDEGQAIDAALNAAAPCSQSSMHLAEES